MSWLDTYFGMPATPIRCTGATSPLVDRVLVLSVCACSWCGTTIQSDERRCSHCGGPRRKTPPTETNE